MPTAPPNQAQTNGAVAPVYEKANGDLKRGIIYEVEERVARGIEPVSSSGQSCYTESNLEKTVARVVEDLNTGARRAESPISCWSNTPPLSRVAHDWAASLHAGAYIDHRDVVPKGDAFEFDTDCVANAVRIIGGPAGQYFVREFLDTKRAPKLFFESGTGTPLELSPITIIGRKMPLGTEDNLQKPGPVVPEIANGPPKQMELRLP